MKLTYVGIIIMLVAIFSSRYGCNYQTRYGKIIDKYKGQASSTNEEGSVTYSDEFYFVIKYQDNRIERNSVSTQDYYTKKIGDNIIDHENIGLNTIGFIAIIFGVIGFILFGHYSGEEFGTKYSDSL